MIIKMTDNDQNLEIHSLLHSDFLQFLHLLLMHLVLLIAEGRNWATDLPVDLTYHANYF